MFLPGKPGSHPLQDGWVEPSNLDTRAEKSSGNEQNSWGLMNSASSIAILLSLLLDGENYVNTQPQILRKKYNKITHAFYLLLGSYIIYMTSPLGI